MTKLNILLVIPRYETYGGNGKYVMPLGILYVSSYLKKSNIANVYTLNMNHHEGSEEEILKYYFKTFNIQILGIGGLSGEFADINRIARLTKTINSQIKIIVGGGVITADAETAMQAFGIADFGVIGEGEITIIELLKAINNEVPIEEISGLIFLKNGNFIKTEARKEIENLDILPFPDYEGFNYKEYLETNPDMSDEGKKYTQVSIIGGRSCKYNCTFCFHPSGSTYRQRSLDSIFKEIDYLTSNYEISYIALREELFATDNQRVIEFCNRICHYDFDWSIQLRVDSINSELVDILRNTRCRYVFVGIESAHDTVLKSMRKGINLQQIEYALNLLSEAGLNSRSGIIFGDKAETFETVMWTYNWYKNNKSNYRMFLDMIIAFPGSKLYIDACQNGIIPDTVQFLKDGCPIVNTSRLNDVEFDKLIKLVEKENHRTYTVKKYINN
ncbi:MAG: B12-binding domain-containing radical SAM protein [Bacteroidales bacterium]|jgi:radical SAM superfamily enzyme YgiQ (UPF0313 family)|nr:B12-binding domain-containing radical SAM protein [Bacteroidales bacterium]